MQASAAMNVDVGNFSDPDALPGLAHFLGNAFPGPAQIFVSCMLTPVWAHRASALEWP